MDDKEIIAQLLKEADERNKRQREEAEELILQNKRQRKEAEEQHRQLLKEADEQHRQQLKEQREEAEELILQEKRQREEAERIVRPQDLHQYLQWCHTLNTALAIITKPTLTTQSDTTKPAGRFYPAQILPWDDFLQKQLGIWDEVKSCKTFCSAQLFPSTHKMEYVKENTFAVSSEIELRTFERDTVEIAVVNLVREVYNDPTVREKLRLKGTITWKCHTNLGEETIPESHPHTPERRGTNQKPRGKISHADQFCIYHEEKTGQAHLKLAIEYKPPHKLSAQAIVRGLKSSISPADDVINQNGEGADFESKRLATAVITQLFASMIGKGIQYGYICTGEVFVFLYIPEDPTIVYYKVCVPTRDVQDNQESTLLYTAVAQVFAFTLQSIRAPPPLLSWYDAAVKNLKTWDVEYIDVLKDMSQSVREEISETSSPYKPPETPETPGCRRKRPRIQNRVSCKQPPQDHQNDKDDEDHEGDGDARIKPTARRSLHQSGAPSLDTSLRDNQGPFSGGKPQDDPKEEQDIQDRPFCTHKCLLGVIRHWPVDKDCPNYLAHGREHIGSSEFLSLLHMQLARDRGPG